MRYYSYSILILFGELFSLWRFVMFVSIYLASTVSMHQNSPPFFPSLLFFLSFGFIIIELNRTWEGKAVREIDRERLISQKRGGGEKEKKAKKR